MNGMQVLPGWQSWLARRAAALASGRGEQASLAILIFHRVVAQRDPLVPSEPDAATFAELLRLLAQNFTALRLTDAVARLRAGTLPPRALCITFDDGYANNHDVALPILKAQGIPATVFVAPGFLNGGRMFNDTLIEALRRAPAQFDLSAEGLGVLQLPDAAARMRAVGTVIAALKHLPPDERLRAAQRIAERCGAPLPNDLMMSDEQVRQLHRAGIEIGAHTMTHPILTRIDADSARREIADSKHTLEALLGAPVTMFAYPNGRPHQDYAAEHVRLAKECGFDCALSTAWGSATGQADFWQLPRLAPWDASAPRYVARIVRGYRQRRYAIA
jgi:peptidoglycan/xylan/chitin deacetylase (PgdA/CDA1 family)